MRHLGVLWGALGSFGVLWGNSLDPRGPSWEPVGVPRGVFCRSQNGFWYFREDSRTPGAGLAITPSNLNSVWSPKCDQNPFFIRLRFRDVFLLLSWCIFVFFHCRPTLDLTAIYTICVGCSIFHGAWRTTEKNIQK